mgnify:FL=1
MLSTLSIENIAVIKHADINFGRHFCVLTGETGAGKSILIDSLNSVLGARTSKELVRHGCDEADISAFFEDVSESVVNKLCELGFSTDDNQLLISRKIGADGRSSCRINGKPATVQMLREIAPLLINIHGQHDNQLLLDSSKHRIYLDRMANLGELLSEYKKAYDEMCSIKKEINSLDSDDEERARRLEVLSYQIDELENANIVPGERQSLNERRNRILNSEKTAKTISSVMAMLSGGERYSAGAGSLVSDAAHELSKCTATIPELEEPFSRLEDMGYELRDITDTLYSVLSELNYSPDEIDEIEQRLDTLYRLSKKYGADEEAMLAFLDDAIAERDGILSYEKNTENLIKRLKAATEKTEKLADELSKKRHIAAEDFSKRVCDETAFLNMPNIKFSAEFTPTELYTYGNEKIEFLISVNLGEPLKPLSKVASGGELSRIMLAIKNVLAGSDDVDTLIFDEIDTGISGRAADRVGLKLKEVGKYRQVICVTHLAQIAAKADEHLLIEKSDNISSDMTETKVFEIKNERRVEEIARIIGGESVSDTTRASAREMLSI